MPIRAFVALLYPKFIQVFDNIQKHLTLKLLFLILQSFDCLPLPEPVSKNFSGFIDLLCYYRGGAVLVYAGFSGNWKIQHVTESGEAVCGVCVYEGLRMFISG